MPHRGQSSAAKSFHTLFMPSASPRPFSFVRPICANLAIFLILPSFLLPALSLQHLWMSLLASTYFFSFFFISPLSTALLSSSIHLPTSFHRRLRLSIPVCLRLPPLPSALTLCFLGKELVSSVGRDPPHTVLTPSPPPCSQPAELWRYVPASNDERGRIGVWSMPRLVR